MYNIFHVAVDQYGQIEILDWLLDNTELVRECEVGTVKKSLVHMAAKCGQVIPTDNCITLSCTCIFHKYTRILYTCSLKHPPNAMAQNMYARTLLLHVGLYMWYLHGYRMDVYVCCWSELLESRTVRTDWVTRRHTSRPNTATSPVYRSVRVIPLKLWFKYLDVCIVHFIILNNFSEVLIFLFCFVKLSLGLYVLF